MGAEQSKSAGAGGYSLLELILCLLIMALIVGLVLPALPAFVRRSRLEAAARQLAGDIRLVRSEAVSGGRESYIRFYEYDQGYRIVVSRQNSYTALPDGVRYAANTFPYRDSFRTLVFLPTGAPNRGGTVALTDSRATLYIIVTPATGRTRLSRDAPRNWGS